MREGMRWVVGMEEEKRRSSGEERERQMTSSRQSPRRSAERQGVALDELLEAAPWR
jgi:hypothetical protein